MVDFLVDPQTKCSLNESTLFKFVHYIKFYIESLPVMFMELHGVFKEFFLNGLEEMSAEKLEDFKRKIDSVLPKDLHIVHPLKYNFSKIHFYKNRDSPSERWILLSKKRKFFLKADFSKKLTLNGDFFNNINEFKLTTGESLEKMNVLGFKPEMLINLAEKWLSLRKPFPLLEKAIIDQDKMPFMSYVFQMSTPPQKWAYFMYSEVDEGRVYTYHTIHEAIVRGLTKRLNIIYEDTLIDSAEQEQHKPDNNFFFFFKTKREFNQKLIVLDLPTLKGNEILCLDMDTLAPITANLTFNDIDLESFVKMDWRKLDEIVKKINKEDEGEPKKRHRLWSFDTRRGHQKGLSGVDVYL